METDRKETDPSALRTDVPAETSDPTKNGHPENGHITTHHDLSRFRTTLEADQKEHAAAYQKTLSFFGYLDGLIKDPLLFFRSPAQLMVATIRHYGVNDENPRYGISQFPWRHHTATEQKAVHGHDEIYDQILGFFESYTDSSTIEQFLLLLGAPGSGKTLIGESLIEGFRHFTHSSLDGYIPKHYFRFGKDDGGKLGFPGSVTEHLEPVANSDDYIILPPETSPPIFLLSPKARKCLHEDIKKAHEHDPNALKGFNENFFYSGETDTLSIRIIEALRRYYNNDTVKILRHVHVRPQVVIPRISQGAGMVPPKPDSRSAVRSSEKKQYDPNRQLHQMGFDQGDLQRVEGTPIHASMGLLYFFDFFAQRAGFQDKVDFLAWAEKGTIYPQDPHTGRHYEESPNVALAGDANFVDLLEVKNDPLFRRHRERLKVVLVPGLRTYLDEKRVHAPGFEQKKKQTGKETGPLVEDMYSLCLCASRLLLPKLNPKRMREIFRPDNHEMELIEDVHELLEVITMHSTVGKAILLQGDSPENPVRDLRLLFANSYDLDEEELRKLKQAIPFIKGEYQAGVEEALRPMFDGREGISTRTGKRLLQELFDYAERDVVTIVDFIELIKAKGPEGFEHDANVRDTLEAYAEQKGLSKSELTTFSREFPVPMISEIIDDIETLAIQRTRHRIENLALGEIESKKVERFRRYIYHIIAYCKGTASVPEKYRSHKQQSGVAEESILGNFEEIIPHQQIDKAGGTDDFRKNLLSKLGAWKIDHPDLDPMDHLPEIYEQFYNQLSNYFREARAAELRPYLEYELDSSVRESTTPEDEREFLKTRRKLIDGGYPESTITRHLNFAFPKFYRTVEMGMKKVLL